MKIFPERNSQAVKDIVVEKVKGVLAKWDGVDDPEDIALMAEAIADMPNYYNGYEVSKRLDDDFGIEPDLELVEDMDNVSSIVREVHRQIIREFIKQNNPACPWVVGELVTYRGNPGRIKQIDQDGTMRVQIQNVVNVVLWDDEAIKRQEVVS